MVAITPIRHRSRTALLVILVLGLVPISISATTLRPVLEPRIPSFDPSVLPERSVWTGKYVCSQGITGVTLTIDRKSEFEAVARFDFFGVPENPDVPTGSYMMSGFADDSYGQIHVAFFPDHWISQPEHYAMTSLSASTDPTGSTLFGRIDGRSGKCTWIDLHRAE